ncbi:hypothetical protein PVT67_07645 [Gallaecimonas kandeliae]|uniref:hypothetical protein n=1 Tax=Gallaecimonas kandeliae TaxID=3029055 RepID=UPI002649D548|nr:hypothetical protein [Gallaecimonas kandeliae]WKE67098.1 hypothetical protein PVT67_07645 [Gallaecimonas kandeliae]
MPIETDEELAVAVRKAGQILQEIQDYCGRENRQDAKVRFPRGYLRTASEQRSRLEFVQSQDLKSNLSYTLILTDSILWLLVRTDIAATAKDMLIKVFIFLGGALIEGILSDYLSGVVGRQRSFKKRTEYLLENDLITQTLHDDLNWVWDMRNNMHLFLLDGREYENSYNASSHVRCANAFKELIQTLSSTGRINEN